MQTIKTWAEISAMTDADKMLLYRQAVKLSEAVNDAKDEEKKSVHTSAKAVAALKRLRRERLDKHAITPDTTEEKWFEMNGGIPSGKIRAAGEFFNHACLTLGKGGVPLLKEEDFDKATAEWLYKSNTIVKLAMKKHGDKWTTSDETLDLVNLLADRPGDTLKKLNAMIAKAKGVPEATAAKPAADAPALTIERAIAFLRAAIKDAAQMDAVRAETLYRAYLDMDDDWSNSGIPEETFGKWQERHMAGIAPGMEIKTGKTPAPAAA